MFDELIGKRVKILVASNSGTATAAGACSSIITVEGTVNGFGGGNIILSDVNIEYMGIGQKKETSSYTIISGEKVISISLIDSE